MKTTDKPRGPNKVALDQSATAVNDFLESLLAPVDEYRLKQEQLLPKLKPAPREEPVVAPPQPAPPQTAPLPDFVEQPFQCLFFKAGGSEFAVPLLSLNGILQWDGKSGKLPGQPDWHRGVISYRGGKMGLVDLSALLGMEHPLEAGKKGYVLAIDEGRFGLICEAVYRPLTLRKEQVKWRLKRIERPWVLGTLREQLCPLVDIGPLTAMLR